MCHVPPSLLSSSPFPSRTGAVPALDPEQPDFAPAFPGKGELERLAKDRIRGKEDMGSDSVPAAPDKVRGLTVC